MDSRLTFDDHPLSLTQQMRLLDTLVGLDSMAEHLCVLPGASRVSPLKRAYLKQALPFYTEAHLNDTQLEYAIQVAQQATWVARNSSRADAKPAKQSRWRLLSDWVEQWMVNVIPMLLLIAGIGLVMNGLFFSQGAVLDRILFVASGGGAGVGFILWMTRVF